MIFPSPQRRTLSDWPSGSYQGLSPPIAQFGLVASPRKSLGASKLLPFKNDLGHYVLGDLQCCRNVLVHNPVSELYGQFLRPHGLVWHDLSTVEPYIDRCVPFQNMSNQLNLPQVDSNQVVETSKRMIKGNRMHLSSISSLIAKSQNTNAK